MFYRVDYTLGIMLAGFLAGLLFSRRTAKVSPLRLGQAYYAAVAALLVLRTLAFAVSLLTGGRAPWSTVGGLLGDLLGVAFGALFGLAMRREDRREFLLQPAILNAITITIAFGFALVGVGKAFSMNAMTEFFSQSGYSLPFLKFIVIAEIFGGIGLLLPWSFVPAAIGLTIDMFGAVLTHIHNGDPLNDSTGAISMLVRLAAVAALSTMLSRPNRSARTFRSSATRVAALGIACFLVAIGGSVVMRHSPPHTVSKVAPAAR